MMVGRNQHPPPFPAAARGQPSPGLRGSAFRTYRAGDRKKKDASHEEACPLPGVRVHQHGAARQPSGCDHGRRPEEPAPVSRKIRRRPEAPRRRTAGHALSRLQGLRRGFLHQRSLIPAGRHKPGQSGQPLSGSHSPYAFRQPRPDAGSFLRAASISHGRNDACRGRTACVAWGFPDAGSHYR